uniref:Protein kinase domain-containing protein n=1 Tax=viral metagenome TaxID=1070528 RepID=A0A6C0H6I6_9ZZZZ
MRKLVKKFYPRYLSHLHQAIAKKHLGTGSFADVSVYQCQEIHNASSTTHVCNQSFVVKQLRFADVGCWNREDMEKNIVYFKNVYFTNKKLVHRYVIRMSFILWTSIVKLIL